MERTKRAAGKMDEDLNKIQKTSSQVGITSFVNGYLLLLLKLSSCLFNLVHVFSAILFQIYNRLSKCCGMWDILQNSDVSYTFPVAFDFHLESTSLQFILEQSFCFTSICNCVLVSPVRLAIQYCTLPFHTSQHICHFRNTNNLHPKHFPKAVWRRLFFF